MNPPSIAYGQLAPMLIVFGVAVAGVLVEAFLPRRSRYPAQLALSLGGLLAILAVVPLLPRLLPEIWALPPEIRSRMTGAEWILLSRTMAKRLPTFAAVT